MSGRRVVYKGLREGLARWLRDALGKAGMTQTQLVAQSGVSRPVVWAILRGRADTTHETLEKLARALNVAAPGREVLEDFRAEVAGPVEASGLDTQLPDDEVIGLILYDRPGFVRYLQTEFGDKLLPTAAKLGRLDFIQKIAEERGITVDREFLDHLRGIIKARGL